MTRRVAKQRTPADPRDRFPKVGEWVVVAHNRLSEPDHWWTSPVEWSNGTLFMVCDRGGWQPDLAPMIYDNDAILAVCTSEESAREILRAARGARAPHLQALRAAYIAADAAKASIIAAVGGAIWNAGGRRARGRIS